MILRLLPLLLLLASPAFAAFPQVVATEVSASGTDITTHTVTLTNGATGNLLVIIVCFDGDPVPTNWTAGYTLIWTGETSVNEGICEARYRVADGSEGASISVDSAAETQKMAAVCLEISGHDSTAPQAGTSVGLTTEFPDPPSLTPSGGAKDYLWVAIAGTDGVTTVDTFPATYTNGTTQGSGGGTGQVTLHWARRELNASSENPGTFDLNVATEQTVAQTFAIAPAAAASIADGGGIGD